jgi:purine-binding chemotaxis protein CheW
MHIVQFCTLFLDGACYGIEVTRVQEIIRYQRLTRVPLAPGVIAGLMNLRGQIVTAVDLRRRLSLPERGGDTLPTNVVINSEVGVVSLLVDEVGDVLQVDSDSFEPPPQTLRRPARDLVRGAYKLKDRLLLVLNTEQVVNVLQ